jgi:hypothetical protein
MMVVAATAAIAGWLLVRLVSTPHRPPGQVETAEHETGAPPARPAPEEAVRRTPAASAREPADDPAAIASDLDVLAQAVAGDVAVENLSFPADPTLLEMPSLIEYVRPVEFWQPAFDAADKDRR